MMATAASNVGVTITLSGQDQASGAINRVAKSSDSAAASFASLTRVAAGAAAAIAAVGAAAAAARGLSAMVAETERLRASMSAVFGENGLQVAIDTARAIGGVGAESVAKLARTLDLASVKGQLTVEQLQKVTAIATKAGKDGDAALTAFADAIAKGNTRSLQQVGIFINAGRVLDEYARSVGKTTTQLTAAEKSQAVFDAAVEKAESVTGAASEAYATQDEALARLDNALLELKARLAESAGPVADIVNGIASAVEVTTRWTRVLLALAKVWQVQMERTFGLGLRMLHRLGQALKGDKSIKRTMMDLFREDTKDAADAWRNLSSEIDKAVKGPINRAADALGAVGLSLPGGTKRRRRGGVSITAADLAGGPARFKTKRRKRRSRVARDTFDPDAVLAADEPDTELTAEDKLANLEARTKGALDVINAGRRKLAKMTANERIVALQAEISAAEAAHQKRQELMRAFGMDERRVMEENARFAEMVSEKKVQLMKLENEQQQRNAQEAIAAADNWIGRVNQVGGALQSLLADQKGMETERAAIELAMTLGEAARLAIRSYYEGDYAGIAFAAANAGIALAQFGKVATAGSGGASSFENQFGGNQSGGGAVGSPGGASGGGRNVTVVFGQGVILGDQHTVARSIKGALTRIEGTGY